MRYLLAAALMTLCSLALASNGEGRSRYQGDFESDKPWQEIEAELPAAPATASLRQIYVSAMATNTYAVDEASVTVGDDRVIRYVLVVDTPGGARNISFEGIHCETSKWKHYASGRSDGSWSKARNSQWRMIENKPLNPHHAALSRYYFCPNSGPILKAEEGKRALRLGRHPDAH
jgi:CNP1-like family